MTELNKYILVVMNYENHTQEELEANFIAAADSAAAAYDAYDDYAAAYSDAAAAAAYSDAAAAAYFSTDDTAEYWIDKYFEITSEDRALYEAEIKRINGANNE